MKKFISIILSLSMLTATFSIGFIAYADALEEKTISNFIENSCEIIREYDKNKSFISEDETVYEHTSDDNENFQTCRLIVKADGAFDDLGAVEHIKGFMGFHILQYKSESDAEIAYNSFLNEKNILSVSVDKIVSPVQAEKNEVDTSTDVFPESTTGVVPQFKGLFSKYFTGIRKAIWKATGYTISNGLGTAITSTISRFVNILTNSRFSEQVDIIICMFSIGGWIALLIDMTDGSFNSKCVLW